MIYRHLFLRFFSGIDFDGTLEIVEGERRYHFGTGPKVSMQVKRGFYRRVIHFGDIGLGEAYFSGDMETEDLKGLLLWFVRNKDRLPGFSKGKKSRLFELAKSLSRALHLLRKNTRRGSRKNISYHYDISNDFYRLWLDETMAYSCAVFGKSMNLKDAQENKFQMICDKINLRKDDHLLEIGTGWGGFAIYAAKRYGCRITTVTISREQFALAKERIRDAGLDGRIDLKLMDYRDIRGSFDKIVSIEMMEALGHEYVPLFIKRCSSLLKDGGKMCVQVITFPDEHFESYLRSQDYIKKHIFPGGELLSVGQIEKESKRNHMSVEDIQYIGKDYAKTLNAWRRNFLRRKREIIALGFDDQFFRKWLYYFIYCEVGFQSGYINDAQILIRKKEK